MNVFEGARRIAFFIGALWAVGILLITYHDTPYVAQNYQIFEPGGGPYRTDDSCLSPNRSEYVDTKTEAGELIYIHLCFVASKAESGRMLIPFTKTADSKSFLMNEAYSDDVTAYTRKVAENFSLPTYDEKYLNNKYSDAKWHDIKSNVKILIIGLFGLWIFTAVMGWIVRGFLGISVGSDKRQE